MSVRKAAKREISAQISITESSPRVLVNGSNMLAPTTAPAFPHAAEIPFKVVLQCAEKVREGSRNVVVFGP